MRLCNNHANLNDIDNHSQNESWATFDIDCHSQLDSVLVLIVILKMDAGCIDIENHYQNETTIIETSLCEVLSSLRYYYH